MENKRLLKRRISQTQAKLVMRQCLNYYIGFNHLTTLMVWRWLASHSDACLGGGEFYFRTQHCIINKHTISEYIAEVVWKKGDYV